jgi:phosphomevalonate kinase
MTTGSYMGFGYAKALIFGEYAVLHGAPGLVAALSPRLYLSLDHLQWLSTRLSETTMERYEDFGKQLQAFLKHFLHTDAKVSLNMAEFFDTQGQKIGIGSSAAAIVALVDAWRQSQNIDFDVHLAIHMHRALQHGMGSGIDIIASALGGIQLVSHCPDAPQITHIPAEHLPCMAILASHIEAPTKQFVAATQAVSHQKDYQHVISEMTEISQILGQYAQTGKKRDFLEQITVYPALLQKLAGIIDMPVIPQVYNALRPIAQDCGVVLKTSGAGGGDIFLALAENPQNIETFVAQIPKTSGVTRLDVQIASPRWNK